jgi:hypothetical protein
MRLCVLRGDPARQVRLLYRDEASSAKDTPGLLKLCRVRELLLVVTSDKDLDPIPVLVPLECRRRLASDMPALEEELCKGPLCAEQRVLMT